MRYCYKVGDVFYYQFSVRGERYRGYIGKVSATVAREAAEKERIKALEGKLVVRPTKAPLFGAYAAATGYTEFAGEFCAWYRQNRRPNSIKRQTGILKTLCEAFGEKRLDQITAEDIDKFTVERKANGWATASVNREIACLKAMYRLALKWKKVETNPTAQVKQQREDNARERYLTPEEEQRLLAHCADNPRLHNLIIAALDTGFRANELATLTWATVDLENRQITVVSGYAKNAETRTNPMTIRLHNVLSQMYRVDPRPSDPVFGPYEYRKALYAAREAAGLGEDVVFHSLRHTYISRLVKAGVNIKTVQEMAGHKTIQMTMRYAHLAPSHKRDAIALIEAAATTTKAGVQVTTPATTSDAETVVSTCRARSSAVRAGDS